MKNIFKILVLLIGFALPIDSSSKGHEHDDLTIPNMVEEIVDFIYIQV